MKSQFCVESLSTDFIHESGLKFNPDTVITFFAFRPQPVDKHVKLIPQRAILRLYFFSGLEVSLHDKKNDKKMG